MPDLPQISEAEFEVMKIVWKSAPINTNEITGQLSETEICNLWISAMILLLFAIKKILKSYLTSRTQYTLWFLPLCLMAIPFIPVPSDRTFSLFSWLTDFIHKTSPGSTAGNAASTLISMDTVSDCPFSLFQSFFRNCYCCL